MIEKGPFITAAGLPANIKVNLEKVHKKDPLFAAEIAGVLAVRLCLHNPDLIVPVPDGANPWGEDVAMYLKSEWARLAWEDKKAGILDFASEQDRQKVINARRIAIVEDVLVTGGTIEKVAKVPEIDGKVVVVGAVWKRCPELMELGYPSETVINSYVPLMENE